jgi:protein-S-isoprenylcysteine O-methyltransferase Ste14
MPHGHLLLNTKEDLIMKNESVLSAFLLMNPFKRGIVEWIILVGTGICGLMFSWYSFSVFPISNLIGGFLILFSFIFHWWSEKDHKQAHEQTDKIDKIINSGVYSRIRHPLYLSLIVLNIGIALSFGILITLILSLLSAIHWVSTSIKEEQMLQIKFQDDYTQYKESVRWRMIPGIF